MEIGYQRELTYQHTDGSYSAFGMSDPSGSTWLTAFVVRSFAQASKYIFIDPEELAKSKVWLLSLQQKDGCFKSVGKVIHKDMMVRLKCYKHGWHVRPNEVFLQINDQIQLF